MSQTDIKIANLAAGFTIGFGFLTTWTAIQQTTQIRSPLRSAYIIMVWGEIFVNFSIAIIAWLFIDGILKPSLVVYFFILFLWVFEIQFLMQIIINRVAVVVEDRRQAECVKWAVAAIITCVNIAVFCIWIPSHLGVSETYIRINAIWDRISKIIILIVDAGLNWYFVKIVKQRLVSHGLTKYESLVRFNIRLMVVSVAMDIMIITLMSLKNGAVYMQFHPVAYMVKLNIEMSMASLITKIARERSGFDLNKAVGNVGMHSSSNYTHNGGMDPHTRNLKEGGGDVELGLQRPVRTSAVAWGDRGDSRKSGFTVTTTVGGLQIQTRKDAFVETESLGGLEKNYCEK